MRNVVGEPVAHVGVARIDQQVHGVGADRAAGKRVLLPRQREPARRPTSRNPSQDFRREVQAGLLLRAGESAHVLVLEAMRRHLVSTLDERLDPARIDLGGDGRHGKRRPEPMFVELLQDEIEPLVRPELRRRTFDVPHPDALGTAGDAQVDDDVDRAALARGPAKIRILEALLIRDRIGVLPGHGTQLR